MINILNQINIILLGTKIWLGLELINWMGYLLIYMKIIEPKFMEFKKTDTIKIIEHIDKLEPNEIEHVIMGCIIYNKITHQNVIANEISIKTLSKKEMIYLIGYSLFGLEIDNIDSSSKLNIIIDCVNKIENKIGIKFESLDVNRYLYRKWGSNFIKFSFRPLILQIPLKLFILSVHLLFVWKLGFNYQIHNGIGFLSKPNFDPNKKHLIFIHGLGFGYIPYFRMLMELNKNYNLTILILPNISSYNYYWNKSNIYFPDLDNFTNTFYQYIGINSIYNPIILSHSFGTYITQILRKDFRSNCFSKVILVDPIIFWIGCFKMSLYIENPLIKNYSIHSYLIDNLLAFMIYQCLYLKYVCFRVMFGPDFWIYDAKELENTNTTIILQKDDYVIPAQLLYDKIKSTNILCHYFDSNDMTHGSILMETIYINKLLEIIEY